MVRALLLLYVGLAVATAGFVWLREYPHSVAAWARSGQRFAAAWIEETAAYLQRRVKTGLDGESVVRLVQSQLPNIETRGSDAEHTPWVRPARAWLYVVTGYDLSQPRTFLERGVPGFARAHRRALDSVGDRSALLDEPASGASYEDRLAQQPGAQTPPVQEQVVEGPQIQPPRVQAPSVPQPPSIQPPEHTAPARESPDEALPAPGIPNDAAPGPDAEDRLRDDAPAVADGGPDAVPAALASIAARRWGDEPLVLIFHTHTAESYRTDPPDPRASETNHVFNSPDTGITRVGEAIAKKLREQYNIGVVHSKRIHDWPHHVTAYRNARETVEELLQRYPSIQVVLDIHRQGIPDYTYATTVGGIDAVGIELLYTTAQAMRYGSHPHWEQNQAFALRLGEAMETIHPGLLRRVIRVDETRYNQDLHPRMLLLEVGNYLDFEDHAIAAAKLLGDALALTLSQIIDTTPVEVAPADGPGRRRESASGEGASSHGVSPLAVPAPSMPRPMPVPVNHNAG